MKEFLSEEFNVEHLPQWFCPTCKIGVLEVGEKVAEIEQTAESIGLKWHPEYCYEFAEYTINIILKCNNKNCGETVITVGTGRVDEYYNYSSHTGEETHEFVTLFKPKYFLPSLNIFNPVKGVPGNIVNMLNKSFALYFCDSDSCGNRIRACVEFLLDELKIPREFKNKGKIKRANLHDRVESLPDEYDKIKGLLLAIKWIGNVGSHGNEGLTKKETIDAYQILKVVLEIIYKPSDDHVFDLAHKINEAKGLI